MKSLMLLILKTNRPSQFFHYGSVNLDFKSVKSYLSPLNLDSTIAYRPPKALCGVGLALNVWRAFTEKLSTDCMSEQLALGVC